jgi:hypothetical protein
MKVREAEAGIAFGSARARGARASFHEIFHHEIDFRLRRRRSILRDLKTRVRDGSGGKNEVGTMESGASGRTVRTTPAACARSEKVSLRGERAWGRQDGACISRSDRLEPRRVRGVCSVDGK